MAEWINDCQLRREILWLGEDLVITIQNVHGHIGAISVAQPYLKDRQVHVTLNTWNQLGHKDDVVACMYAKAIAIKIQRVVTCICGIHIDDITERQIETMMSWVENDISCLLKELNYSLGMLE